jgi:RNA polymerase sigma-70 factor (ECF subfamily)
VHRESSPSDPGIDIAALRAGDRDALATALGLLLPRIRTWLFRLLGPRAGLDDAVQDSLIEVARALPRFRGDSTLTTYVHRITLRVGYRHLRRRDRDRDREVPLALVPPMAGGIDPESHAAQREILRRLYQCLDRLSTKRRVALVLCDIEGYTPSEAAAVVNVPATTLRARLKHARRDLDRLLQDEPYLRQLEQEGPR